MWWTSVNWSAACFFGDVRWKQAWLRRNEKKHQRQNNDWNTRSENEPPTGTHRTRVKGTPVNGKCTQNRDRQTIRSLLNESKWIAYENSYNVKWIGKTCFNKKQRNHWKNDKTTKKRHRAKRNIVNINNAHLWGSQIFAPFIFSLILQFVTPTLWCLSCLLFFSSVSHRMILNFVYEYDYINEIFE